MTQEALKLAEDYAHMRAIWYVESLYGTSASHTELREKVMLGAHQALKEALAQTQEPVALETLLKWDDDIDDIDPIGEVVGFIEGSPYIMVKVHKGKQVSLDDDLYATPPQRTEQEPVAHWSDCAVHSEPAYPKGECDCGGIVAVADYTALSDKYVALSDKYVALKAQRTWQGLTDEDISEIVRGTHNTGSFVRAIESKLKQKNGYAEEKNT